MPQDEWAKARNKDIVRDVARQQRADRQRLRRPPAHMPFGAYKGQKLEQVPVDYLEWVLHNLQLEQLLRDALSLEVIRRKHL